MSEHDNLKLSYKVPYARIIKLSRSANRHTFRDIWLMSWALRLFFIAFALAIIAWPERAAEYLYMFNKAVGLPPEETWLPMFGIVGAFIGGLFALRHLQRKRLQQRVDFDETIHLTAEERGVRFESSTLDYFLKWAGIREIYMEPDGPVLAHGTFYFLIPNDAFASEQQRVGFLRHILARLEPEAREKSERQLADALAQ